MTVQELSGDEVTAKFVGSVSQQKPSDSSDQSDSRATPKAASSEPSVAAAVRPEPADLPNRQTPSASELANALAEAQEIVLYTVRHGIEVPDDVLKTIATSTRKNYSPDQWSEEDKVRFWQSARTLSKLVQPVSIGSIRATGSGVASLAWSAVTLMSLFILVATQIIWVFGTTLTTNINDIREQLRKTTAEIELAEARRTSVRAEPSNIPEQSVGGSRGEQVSVRQQSTPAELEAAISSNRKLITELAQRREAQLGMLAEWIRSWPINRFGYTGTPRAFQESAGQQQRVATYLQQQLSAVEARDINDELLLASASTTLKAMSAYVLPLLYGLVGAAAYVMRSLSKDISDVTYTYTSNLRFALRLILGMLSGISVGLILTPESNSAVLSPVTITPLAMAFLAGYSVELLFSAMDRLISAFSSDAGRAA